MGKFLNSPNMKNIGKGKFQLAEPLEWLQDGGTIIRVPKDFITDGYSKPDLYFFGENYDDDIRPAILHDWRCETKNCTEKEASIEFLEAMLSVGIEPRKAKLMYKAVRFFQIFFCKGWKK